MRIAQPISPALTEKLASYLLPAIILLTLAVFSPVIGNDFVNYDDPPFVLVNPNIQHGLTLEAIRWAFTTGLEANWIPLSWLSHMLDVQLFGLNPAGHHGVSLLLHTASTALLFLFLRRTTGAPWRSALVALFFALHPLHVESVAWVAERKDVLSAFFWMATLYAYARYAEQPGPGRYLLALLLFTLGLLAKPMVVTLPLILLLLDHWPLQRLSGTSLWRLLAEKVPLFCLAGASSLITYLIHRAESSIAQDYTLPARIARVAVAYCAYLAKTFWPTKLAVIYPFEKYPPTPLAVGGALLLLLTITLLTIRFLRRAPYLLTGWCWYLVVLVPVIGFVQIGQHSIADRYTYLSLIGVFIMLVWSAPTLLPASLRSRPMLAPVAVALLAILSLLTVRQLRYWRNSTTLFTHAVAVTRGNWIAHNNLGQVLLEEGRLPEAITHFKASIDAKPSYEVAFLNLGIAYRRSGDYTQALDTFRQVLHFNAQNPAAHLELGLLYLEMGNLVMARIEHQVLTEYGSEYAENLGQELARAQSPSVTDPTRR